MVWTAVQTGAFLDHIADDPLYPLFHLMALRGLRRGEACGLQRSDLDGDNKGEEAARTALEMVDLLRRLPPSR